jgi:nucleotide-binding universal stress UspA family protein
MKILLAIDDSKFSEAAIQMVVAQARPQDTEVRVLHVLLPPSLLLGREMGGYDPEIETLWKAQREQAKALLTKTTGMLRTSGFNVASTLEEGDPKSKIIDVASEWSADLIVLGSHGRKGMDRFFMGSVAESVARHASCSVEIVRLPSAR